MKLFHFVRFCGIWKWEHYFVNTLYIHSLLTRARNPPKSRTDLPMDVFIRALVSARGSEQKRKKQKQSPRLKSRLPVPLYVFMTKTENRNFRRLIKQFPPGQFIQKSSQEFLFWLQTTSQNFKLNRYIGQELHRLEIWQN